MQNVAVLVLAALCVSFAVLTIALEQSVRAAACLMGAAMVAAGLAFVKGVGDLSVVLITTCAAGSCLLLLMLALLLNLTLDETGGRRFRFWPVLYLMAVLWTTSTAYKFAGSWETQVQPPLPAGASSIPLLETLGLGLALVGIAFLASLLTLIIVARRSS